MFKLDLLSKNLFYNCSFLAVPFPDLMSNREERAGASSFV